MCKKYFRCTKSGSSFSDFCFVFYFFERWLWIITSRESKSSRPSTGTRITISDKYALSGNGNLVENTKRETSSCILPFFKIRILPRNISHRPSKCQELNKFYIFTYLCYWCLLLMLFSNISWPDLTKRTRSLLRSL